MIYPRRKWLRAPNRIAGVGSKRTQSIEWYLALAAALERGAAKLPCSSGCRKRKLDLARRCRLKAAQLQQEVDRAATPTNTPC